jgi:AcrR family transcriptional regulator
MYSCTGVMEMSDLDRRYRRSRIAFREAYLDLLDVKPQQSITVKEITNRAGYSRSSFYNQFADIADFIQSLVDDEIANYSKILREIHQKYNRVVETEIPRPSYVALFEYIYLHRRLYKFLFSGDTLFQTMDYFVDEVNKQRINYQINFHDPQPPIYLDFFCYMMENLKNVCVRYWIKTVFRWSPKYMAEQTTIFFRKTIKSTELLE